LQYHKKTIYQQINKELCQNFNLYADLDELFRPRARRSLNSKVIENMTFQLIMFSITQLSRETFEKRSNRHPDETVCARNFISIMSGFMEQPFATIEDLINNFNTCQALHGGSSHGSSISDIIGLMAEAEHQSNKLFDAQWKKLTSDVEHELMNVDPPYTKERELVHEEW
jgi:hypothetical protein